MRVSVGLDANVHAAPLDHNTSVVSWFNSTTESQIRKIAGASVFVVAIDPLALKRLGLKLGKFHNQTSNVIVVDLKTSRQISSISVA